jgi:DNA-binding CsgD family transcriptional regulator
VTRKNEAEAAAKNVAVARPLSRRQLEVLELAAKGRTNSETAAELDISIHAVKYHLAGAYRKLGAANRTEAAVTYLRGLQPDAAGG